MILDRIVRYAEERAAGLPDMSGQESEYRPVSLRDSISAVKDRNAVIAEIKFSSPSLGRIRVNSPVEGIAMSLAGGGCTAISVLTEPRFFGGNTDYIRRVRRVTSLPILRKDFIVDKRQIYETRMLGADAVLLIAGLLGDRLADFVTLSLDTGLEPLVEVHNSEEADLALESGAELIGINNRDLRTMRINLQTTELLSGRVHEAGRLVVSESGISSPADLRRLKRFSDAYLIGSAIMAEKDPGRKVETFVCV